MSEASDPAIATQPTDSTSVVTHGSVQRPQNSQARLLRLVALGLAVLPLTLLLVASRLQPSSAGLGTHQQLGLPPCSMRVIAGIRCPGCGMTTSWAHFTRGQWQSSFQVNAGGFLLAGYSLVFAWIALRTCWSGQFPSLATQRAMGVGILAIAAVTLVDWSLRLLSG